jgi:hypothetical protein
MQTGGSRPRAPDAGKPGSRQSPADAREDTFEERPELFVGAAFAGGLVVAGLLRWLGRE